MLKPSKEYIALNDFINSLQVMKFISPDENDCIRITTLFSFVNKWKHND